MISDGCGRTSALTVPFYTIVSATPSQQGTNAMDFDRVVRRTPDSGPYFRTSGVHLGVLRTTPKKCAEV